MWIDSHTHLNHERTEDVPDTLIARAQEAGVDGILTICCRMSEELEALSVIAAAHDNVWFSIGTHPHDAGLPAEQAITADDIVKNIMANKKAVGIGETGLDYFYDNAPREDQKSSFIKHIHAAKEANVPLIIHTRDAEEDTMQILRDEGACDGKTKILMHCFSSNNWLAQQSIDEGFTLSFSGMVTFKKNIELQEIARTTPLDQILVETDAPYLAPMPHRGKTNEPAFVAHTGQFIADLRNLTYAEFAKATTQNFFKLFDKAKLG